MQPRQQHDSPASALTSQHLPIPLPASPADCKALVGQECGQHRNCSPDIGSRVRLADDVKIHDLYGAGTKHTTNTCQQNYSQAHVTAVPGRI